MIGIKQKYQDLFFQTEQTVNRKKSGFLTAPIFHIFTEPRLEIQEKSCEKKNTFIKVQMRFQ